MQKATLFKKLISLILLVLSFTSDLYAQEISPMLVGNNAWYTNPSDQVWQLTKDCGVKTIRIGGNAYNDNMPSNGTLSGWVDKIREIGAVPIIQVSQKISASQAAGVVQYFNVTLVAQGKSPIKYWNIGNEPWLEANEPPIADVAPDVESYFKPLSAAMKEVDPTIKIFGPDFSYYIEEAINDLFGGANDIAGKIPGKDYYYCDGISWHRYPQDNDINLAYEGLAGYETSIKKCKAKVDQINNDYNRTGEDALEWSIGEFNAKDGSLVHTWENGQMFGGVLGLCMKYEAKYAATWSMFENSGSRQGSDFSFIDGQNMVPRASYRHLEFVAKHFTGEYLNGESSNTNTIVFGAKDGNKISMMIMNRESGRKLNYTVRLNLENKSQVNGELFSIDASSSETYSASIDPNTTHVLIFENQQLIKYTYNSNHFDNELAPSRVDFNNTSTDNSQTAFEIAIATDYQNVINKAQNTYMRPKDGAANQKIHQWETSAQAAGDF
ncbi:MAG: hypothetical protein RIC03_17580, partial [Cyclobacteriaceae bacterium]